VATRTGTPLAWGCRLMDPSEDKASTVSENFRERLIGACGPGTWRPYAAPVELDELLARLILFKTYILESARLEEIDHLFPVLGYDGLLRLLSSGAFEIDLSYASIAYLREIDEGFAAGARCLLCLTPSGHGGRCRGWVSASSASKSA
jgi:hypothetical protein